MAETLRLENVALAFGGLQVLKNVTFEAHAGELLCLIGPNGAGKTSVLNCICGIYQPGTGTISFGDQTLTREAPHRIARLGIARTFQHGELFAHLSVLENLLVARHARIQTSLLAEGLRLPGVRLAESDHRAAVERVLDFTDLERWRHEHVGALPFGLQKIVGFARALAMEPRVLLLDEPSAGLNRDERENLARYILRIKHELGIAMVWVEHDMQMVADLADRLYVLDHGEPIAEGNTADVLANPKVIAAYLGQPAS